LMTGETDLGIGKRSLAALLSAVTILIVGASFYSLDSTLTSGVAEAPTMSILQFVWVFRPWDLLILVIIFAGAMTVVVNLLSKEQ